MIYLTFIFISFLGMDNFESLLRGGNFMDNHFRNTPLEQNVSVSCKMSVYDKELSDRDTVLAGIC